jgi:hypothetical protein
MEYILIHTPNNNLTPQTMLAVVEMGKKLGAKPGQFVPGGKLLASYAAKAKMFIVCLWEVSSIDALIPTLEQMSMMGFNTEVIPAEKLEVKLDKLAKALSAAK